MNDGVSSKEYSEFLESESRPCVSTSVVGLTSKEMACLERLEVYTYMHVYMLYFVVLFYRMSSIDPWLLII